ILFLLIILLLLVRPAPQNFHCRSAKKIRYSCPPRRSAPLTSQARPAPEFPPMADSESIACPSSAVAESSIEPTAPYLDVPPQDEAAATLTDSPHGDGPDSGISRVAGRYRIVKPHGSG